MGSGARKNKISRCTRLCFIYLLLVGFFVEVVAMNRLFRISSLGRAVRSPISRRVSLQMRSVNTNKGYDPPTGVRASITLEDGTVLNGYSFGAEKSVNGEIVFSTGMTGYTEALTDPSFRGQMLTLTYPMIGNYGVPCIDTLDEHGLKKGFESDRIHAAALICQDYSHIWSHWDGEKSLGQWLKDEGFPLYLKLITFFIQ